jgi:TatA/E family protein of Tat protein translocase
MNVGPPEILVILIVALLVFGPKRLPEVGRQVGSAVREIRRMQDAVRGEIDMVLHPEHGSHFGDEPDEPGDHTSLPPAASSDLGLPTGEVAASDMSPPDLQPPDQRRDAFDEPEIDAEADQRFRGPSGSFS